MGAHYVRVSYWLNESPFLLLCVGQEAHSSLGFYGSLSRCPVATHVALGPQLMQSHTWGRISVSLSWSFLLRFFLRWPYPNPSSSTRNQKVSSLSLFLPSQGKNPFWGWNSASKFLPEVSWLHTSSSSHSGIGKSGRLTLCCCLLRCQKLPLRQPAGWILGQQWATTYPYFRNTALKCCACGLSVHIQSPLVSFTSVFPPSDTCCGNWCGNPQDFLRNPSAHRAYLLLTDVNPSDTIFFILVPLRNLNFWKKNLEEECKLL